MDFYEVIQSRKSVRNYSSEPIPAEIIDKMLEAARLAPSYQNRQCWHYIIVKTPEQIKKLALNSGLVGKVNYFIKDAPLIVVACADPAKSGGLNNKDYYLVDTAISFQQMMLTAWNYGIGSCWLAAFNEKKVKDILKIPERIKVVALSPFGYPKDKETIYGKLLKLAAGSKKRKDLKDITSFDRW